MINKIGIDFGTCNCSASYLNLATGKPEVVQFYECADVKMPSVVYFSPEGVVVGKMAYEQLDNSSRMKEEDRNLILSSIVTNIKTTMQANGKYYLPNGQVVSHVDVISEIFKKIKQELEETCFQNNPIQAVVLTHPVVFVQWKKKMLVDAALKAGFQQVQLLEEPVAAALGYSASTNTSGNGFLIYDFGGGTFDVAYVEKVSEGKYRVPVEPEGDSECGGKDIDALLYGKWEQIALKKYSRSVGRNLKYYDQGFLVNCKRNKESMSLQKRAKFSEILPPPGFYRVEMEITREDFNLLIEEVIEKTIKKTQSLLSKIEQYGGKIDEVIMIGGSSRIPLVYERLKKILPIEPRRVMQVDMAVALGAVLYDIVKLKEEPFLITSYSGIPESKSEILKGYCILCGEDITSEHEICPNPQCRHENYLYKKESFL